MTHKHDQTESVTENLLGAGQRILGNLESIGGILTGDPATAAEGEFNANVGTIHQETSRAVNEPTETANANERANDSIGNRI